MCEKVSSTWQRGKACCSRQDRDVRKRGDVRVQLLPHALIPEIKPIRKIIHASFQILPVHLILILFKPLLSLSQ